MISVSGIEYTPALLRSSAKALSTPFAALAPPNSPTKNEGWAFPASAMLVSTGSSLSAAVFLSPLMSKSISTAWRSPAIFGAWTLRTTATFDRRATTSSIAAAKAGVPVCSERFWIRTLSPAGCLKPASRILSIRPDSPGPLAFGSICFVPIWPPRAKATTTRASQPKVAVFQWAALQRPMRAARLRFWFSLRDMRFSFQPLGGVREGVVEGVEGSVRRNRELEAVSEAVVIDGDRDRVLPGVPEQQDVYAVALACGELAGVRGCGTHVSSCHGMSTSLTLVAVVRSAT